MNYKNSTELVSQIEFDMRSAIKARNLIEVNALKALLARFSNEETVNVETTDSSNISEAEVAGTRKGVGSTEVSRKVLSLADREKMIKDEVAEMQHVIDRLDQPSDYKADLEQKVIILQRYLD